MDTPLLEISALTVAFDTSRSTAPIRPVQQVSLSIFPGQTLAVVGESGSGKSVTALSILQLIPKPPGKILGGVIRFDGRDLLPLSDRQMQSVRGKDIAMIFQEPMTSLNPVFTVGEQIIEAIALHQKVSARQAREIAGQSLRDVGIADAMRRLDDYPHQMSGGMRQRVMIAMALSCKPRLLIADEPTTALDVTIQAQILELLRKLQGERGMSILLITHDLGVVAENADVVAVMYASRVVEYAPVEALFDKPNHPYTRGLLNAVPKLGDTNERLQAIPGSTPNPAKFPTGCKFHPRCALTRQLASSAPAQQATDIAFDGAPIHVMRRCVIEEPMLRQLEPQRWAACWFAENYENARPVESAPMQLNVRRSVSRESVSTIPAANAPEATAPEGTR
jgi:oligopeptide/dipeptide ABC transporter ATP-binding protein